MGRKQYVQANAIRPQSNLLANRGVARELSGNYDNYELCLGRVTAVDYSKGMVSYSLIINGKIQQYDQVATAMLPVYSYGINDDGEAYGKYLSAPVGSLILIGYIKGLSSRPIVIGTYADNGVDLSNLASGYTKGDRNQEERTVYPSQQVSLIKDNGEYTRTFNGQSFLTVVNPSDDENSITDKVIDEDYDGVTESYLDGLWSPLSNKAYDMSLEAPAMLLQHQSNVSWDKHRTKFLIKPTGEFLTKLVNMNHPERTIGGTLDLNRGAYLYRTFDNLSLSESQKNALIKLTEEGSVLLQASDLDRDKHPETGSIEVTPQGTKIDGDLVASMQAVTALSKKLESLSNSAQSLEDLLNKIGTDFMLKLPQTIATQGGNISRAQESADSATKKAEQVEGDLKTSVDGINKSIKEITGNIEGIENDLTNKTSALQKSINSVSSSLDSYKSSNNTAVKNLQSSLSSLQTTVSDIQDVIKPIGTLQSDVNKLKADVSNALSIANNANNGANSNYWRVYNLVTQLNNSKVAPDYTFMVDDTKH